MKNITEALSWRYATKKFDQNKKIDDSTLEIILESLRLSPSSYGLQPWKFIVVNNKEIREQIKIAAYGQSQITDASHLIVFANKKNIDSSLVKEYIELVAKERGLEVSALEGLEDMINGSFTSKTNEDLRNWASRQLYLSAGVFLTSCAVSSVDACPMEGVDMISLNKILNLDSFDLEARMVVAVGYRSDEDRSSLYKKVRFPKNDVFINVN